MYLDVADLDGNTVAVDIVVDGSMYGDCEWDGEGPVFGNVSCMNSHCAALNTLPKLTISSTWSWCWRSHFLYVNAVCMREASMPLSLWPSHTRSTIHRLCPSILTTRFPTNRIEMSSSSVTNCWLATLKMGGGVLIFMVKTGDVSNCCSVKRTPAYWYVYINVGWNS